MGGGRAGDCRVLHADSFGGGVLGCSDDLTLAAVVVWGYRRVCLRAAPCLTMFLFSIIKSRGR